TVTPFEDLVRVYAPTEDQKLTTKSTKESLQPQRPLGTAAKDARKPTRKSSHTHRGTGRKQKLPCVRAGQDGEAARLRLRGVQNVQRRANWPNRPSSYPPPVARAPRPPLFPSTRTGPPEKAAASSAK